MGEFALMMQWWDDEPIEVGFDKITVTLIASEEGSFELVLDQKWLDVLIAGMKFWIEYDGKRTPYKGRLGFSTANLDNTVTFNGTDELGTLNNRIVDFKAAGFTGGIGDKLQEVEASVMLQQLFKTYTGKDGSDSNYNITKYVVPSITTKHWVSGNQDFVAFLRTLAISAGISTTDIGYVVWIDEEDNIHFESKGTGKIWRNNVFEARNPTVDTDRIINLIKLRGINPSTIPPDRNAFTEYIIANTDLQNYETSGTSAVTISMDSSIKHASLGAKSIRVQLELDGSLEWDGATTSYWFQMGLLIDSLSVTFYNTSGLPTIDVDWSDGEGADNQGRPAVRRPSSQEDSTVRGKGNFTLEYITFKSKFAKDTDGVIPVNWGAVSNPTSIEIRVWVNTNGGSTTFDRTASKWQDPKWIKFEQITSSGRGGNLGYGELRFYPRPTTEGGDLTLDIDPSDVNDVIIELYGPDNLTSDGTTPGGINPVYWWIDELTMHFQEVLAIQKNVESINKWELREKPLQDRNVNNWKTAHATAKGILKDLAEPSHSAGIMMPWNPGMRINDRIPVNFHNQIRDMIVKKIVLNIDTNGAGLQVDVGDKRPEFEGVLDIFRVIEEKQQSGGSGYKLEASYARNKCIELCETECEEDCLIETDQTTTKILSDDGIKRYNPCASGNCQTYVQL